MSRIIKTKENHLDNSTLNKIKSVFEDNLLYFGMSSTVSQVRQRVMGITYDVLRRMAERLSVASLIINTREQQCTPFFKIAREPGEPGFVIQKRGKNRFRGKDKRAEELEEFFHKTGYDKDPEREDDFIDYSKMQVREVLTIDQIAVELQKTRSGEVGAFWLIDGATISRCTSRGYEENPDLAYVQEIRSQIMAAYTRDELVFDCMFKRVDLRHRGYGYSPLEQAVDLVTALILGISHNRDQFTKDKVPKGFIALQGDADRETIETIERYWYMAMSGVGAKFSIPILPTGREGVSMDFKSLGQSNKDLEYYKLMTFFLSLFAGVFSMDLAELGIRTDNTQQALGENIEGRQFYSKDRGLKTLLTYLQSINGKILSQIDEDYEFAFVGINPKDELKKYEVASKAVGSVKSMNEVRDDIGLDKIKISEIEDPMDLPLNPSLLQAMQMPQFGGQGSQEEGSDRGEKNSEDSGEWQEPDDSGEWQEPEEIEAPEEIEKSLRTHIEELKKAGHDIESYF
jgi:hypothetical protein